MPKVSEYASTVGSVSKVKQQLISSGAGKSNVINPERLYDNAGSNVEHNVVGGTVVATPIQLDPEASNFVKSDNSEISDNTKSNSYKVVYYYSTEKSQEIQPPSKELLALPETDPKYQLFIANLAQGIGGGRIIIDSSKEKIPSRGDKISFQSVKGDHAFSSKIISIDESEDFEASEGTPSLKDQSKSSQVTDPQYEQAEGLPTSDPSKNPAFLIPSSNQKMKIKTLPADKIAGLGGYTTTSLRTDAAEAYMKLYNEVKSFGGVITSAGGFVIKGRVRDNGIHYDSSMHSLGVAFDMSLDTGMSNLQKQPYIITQDPNKGKGRWIVWCKTNNPKVPIVTLQAILHSGKTTTYNNTITTRAFNFTELAVKYGFIPIPANKPFFEFGTYTASEWWHFQFTANFVKGKTLFGEEVLKIYSEAEAEKKYQGWNQGLKFFKYAIKGGFY